MMWNVCRIDDLGDINRGKSKHRPRNDARLFGGKYPFIQTGDVKKANLYITEFDTTYSEFGLAQSRLWPKDTLCITIAANIAESAILGFDACFPDSVVGFVPKKNKADLKFVKYLLDEFKVYMQQISKGTTQDNLSLDKLRRVKFYAPDYDVQVKIAKVISAYDDLIENNNKRIKILEKMAENLYKEWFVRFRFPGYEQAEFENGIPKGWETKRLGDELEVKRGGSPRPIHEYLSDTGLKWLKISDATQSDNPYIVNIEESIIEEGLKKTVYLKAGSLVLSNSATPGLPRILTIDSCIHDGWLYFPKKKLSNEYLYLLFNHIRPHLLSKGNGAIFTNLKTDILKRYLFTKPTDIILSLFNDLVKPIFGQIYSLTMKNQNLTKQRDMLLPRLMFGKLEV